MQLENDFRRPERHGMNCMILIGFGDDLLQGRVGSLGRNLSRNRGFKKRFSPDSAVDNNWKLSPCFDQVLDILSFFALGVKSADDDNLFGHFNLLPADA